MHLHSRRCGLISLYVRLHANEKTMFQNGKKKNNKKISRMPEDESRVHINAVTQSIDNFSLIAVSHFGCAVLSARCRFHIYFVAVGMRHKPLF